MKIASYPAYRPSGTDWLGEIPTHWEMRRLRYCVSIINEKVNGQGTDLPYIGLENIESWTGRQIQQGAEPSFSEGQSNLFKSGDVLFGKLRPYLAKVLRAKENGICTGELLVLRPKEAIQDYLFYYLLAKNFIDIVDSSTYGAKMPRANWDFIGGLSVLIPNANEQRDIAAFLELVTARIDGLITKKEQLIELLQEKRAALISHVVTKGIDPKVSMKDSGVEWLGKIPEHWKVKRLKRLAGLRAGFGITSETIEEVGEYPVFGGNGIRGFTSSYTHEGELPIIGRQGALCGCVNFAHGKFWASEHAVVATPEPEVNPHWLTYLLRAMSLNTYSQSAAQPGLAVETISALQVCMPDITEQNAIAAFLDKETTKIDTLNSKIQNAIEKLKEYRTALISAAVTGKIDVRQEVA